MIENTFDNRDKIAKLIVDSMDEKSLKHFVENKIWTMLGDNAYFARRLEILTIGTQEELDMRLTLQDYQTLTVKQAAQLTREQLIAFLAWNDRNGVYTDEDCEAEGYDLLTLESARLLVIKAITGE